MDSLELTKWQKKLQISPVEIIREEKEVFILDRLSQSSISRNIIFKGGTTLRLVYGSPRFSQDLDFSLIKKFPLSLFKKILKVIASEQSEFTIADIHDKRNTIFGLILVKSELLKQNFSIKIEISKRDKPFKKGEWSLMAVRSPISILTPLVYSCSLQRIVFEKQIAIKTRGEPRDYFDLWWIGEKLGLKIQIPKPNIHSGKFKGEINQLLPEYLKDWSKNFIKQYERS